MTLPDDDLALTASAARARVEQHRLERDREAAVRRVRTFQNLTAAWKPLSSEFLSAKAKLQPRDSKGRWIDMGATVRWLMGSQIGGDKSKLSGAHGKKSYAQGKVTGFDPKTKKYSIKPTDGGSDVQLEGKDLEVIKAVIPDSPDDVEAKVSDEVKNDAFGSPPKPAGAALTDKNGEELGIGDTVKLNGYMVGEITSGPDAKGRFEGKNTNGGGHMYFKPGDDLELFSRGSARPDAPESDPRKALAERAGLTDEEMADAPELLPSVENLRRSVTDANFLSEKDLADFNDYLDEVQIAPGGRSAGQWDAIEEFLDARMGDGAIPDQDDFTNVLDTMSAARRDSLDSPGEDTIESLDKPAAKTALPDDLPDPTGDALTVPESWSGEDAAPAGAGESIQDADGNDVQVGDLVNWKHGIYGGKDYPVVDITPEGYPVVENPHWPVAEGGTLRTLKPADKDGFGADARDPVTFTKATPDVEMTPEIRDVLSGLDTSARYAGFSNDGYDKAASGREGAYRAAIELVRKKGLTPELVAELRNRAEQDSHRNDYSGFDDHNPYYSGSSKTYGQIADDLEKRLPKKGPEESPAGNITEFAKNMFQNLHPDSNWDEADQTAWLEAAKKAMEKPND